MIALVRSVCVATLFLVSIAPAQLPPIPMLRESPWNGDWVLSRTRNPKTVMEEAAKGYRLHVADNEIRWEIPSLGEVVEGHMDGNPMVIRRPGSMGHTLAITADGPYTLLYIVARGGKPVGEGRMTLVDHGTAWVDISQAAGRPDMAHVVIYVRPSEAEN